MPEPSGATIRIVPANEASCADLDAVFGARGDPARCRCQFFRLPRADWRAMPVEERAERHRRQAGCGHPGAPSTSGLVAYLDGAPAGWCAVEPRTAYPRHPRQAHPLDRPRRGSGRPRRLGRHLLRHPRRLPPPRRQPRPRPRRRRLRPRPRRPRPRRLRALGAPRRGDRLGRPLRRQPQRLRRRRLHRGLPPHRAPRRDAHRLPRPRRLTSRAAPATARQRAVAPAFDRFSANEIAIQFQQHTAPGTRAHAAC